MYAVIYGDMENGENIEVEGLFQTRNEAVKALYESASKTFDSLNIDIESCEKISMTGVLVARYTRKVPGQIVVVKMDMLCFGM